MVQVIQGQRDLREIGTNQLAEALGQGLGSALNTYFINRSLDSVLKDKSLESASPSERMSRIEQEMRPFGQRGQQVFKNRIMIEEQAGKEIQEKKDKKKAGILKKRLEGEELSEEEKGIFSPEEEFAIAKHEQAIKLQDMKKQQALEVQKLKNQGKSILGGLGGQPVPQEFSNEIENVLSQSQDLNADQLALKMDKAGIPTFYSKSYVENRRRDDDMRAKKADEAEKLDMQSFKDNKEYRDKILNGFEAYKRDEAVLDQMEKISNEENLPKPLFVSLLQKLGLPIGIMENPSAEQFDKLSQELMKNITGTYGNRILQSEVVNFLRSIPTLLNSAEGKKRLIKQWKILNEGKRIYYDSYKDILKENPKRLPSDLHEKVLERSEHRLDELSERFKNMNMLRTVIDPNGIERLIPEEMVEKALKAGGHLL